MSTAQKSRILRAAAVAPVTIKQFTQANATLAVPVRHMEKFAAELVADGLLTQRGDLFWITPEGVSEVTKPTTVASPTTWCAASTQGTYQPPTWHIRAGADDHMRYRSLTTSGEGA